MPRALEVLQAAHRSWEEGQRKDCRAPGHVCCAHGQYPKLRRQPRACGECSELSQKLFLLALCSIIIYNKQW